MPAIWEYPPELLAILQKEPTPQEKARREERFQKMREEAIAREEAWKIARAAEEALRLEKEEAFNWCRRNGNPHRGD